MAGYKRPYPDSCGPGYYPPGGSGGLLGDRPQPPSRPYGNSYHSGAQWSGQYQDRPMQDYPPSQPRDYNRQQMPSSDNYYLLPTPQSQNYGPYPTPPGPSWDRPPSPKREYNPGLPSYSTGQDAYRPPNFNNNYSANYGNNQYNNNRGQGGQFRGQRGRGFGNTNQGHFSSQETGHNSGGYQSRGGGFQGQSRGHGNEQGRRNDRGRGDDWGHRSDRGQGRGGRGSFRGAGSDRGRGRGRGRDMPDRNSGGGGRGTDKPPNAQTLDEEGMSTPEKLHRFCLYVKKDDIQKGNSISTIVCAVGSSKLGLNLDFESTGLAWVSQTKVFTGTLKLDNVFIARNIGMSKKEMKKAVFDKALDILTTKSVDEIYNLKDEGADYYKDQILGDIKEKPIKGKKPTTTEGNSPLVQLVNYVKAIPEDAIKCIITMIEEACARFCFVTSFKFEWEPPHNLFHKAKFTYDGVVLARGHGENKKKCKREVFKEVYRRLTTCTIEELEVSVPDKTTEELAAANKYEKSKPIRDEPLEHRLEEFLSSLKDQPASSSGATYTIDTIATHCGLYPMLIFRPTNDSKTSLSTTCDLYIENIYIASGQSIKRRESSHPAYLKAFEILTKTTAEELLDETKFPRLKEEELHNPKFRDIIFKGTGKMLDSNLEKLKKNGFDIDNLTNTVEDDFVVVEYHNWAVDRTKHAFMILNYSCAQNGLFMQWKAETVLTHNTFKCCVFINGKEVGSSYGFGRNHAKNLACMDVLYKYYEKYDAILIHHFEEIKDYIEYSELKEKAAQLRKSGITPVAAITPPAAMVDVAVLTAEDEDNKWADPYFCTVIQQMLDELKARNNDDGDIEIRIGPGFTPSEWVEVRSRVRAMNYRYGVQHKQDEDGKEIFVITKNVPWKEMAGILKKQEGNRCGKYELLVGDEKPKYSDIEEYVLKEFSSLRDRKSKHGIPAHAGSLSKKDRKRVEKILAQMEEKNNEQDLKTE